ncbi:MAG: hypothetical protein EAZ20_02910 [Bacteroidetes bacterium]|nr:MAG: hypothetical protein EAZ20_02910 [Bacteroidota bacterium]
MTITTSQAQWTNADPTVTNNAVNITNTADPNNSLQITTTSTDAMPVIKSGNDKMKFGEYCMFINRNKVGIGVNLSQPIENYAGFNLFVKDGIRSERVKVDVAADNGWADFVFEKNYKLRTLAEVEAFIQKNKHLPDVPSEKELTKNGMDLAEMHKIQMQKIEELTLYLIELKKENDVIKKELEALKASKK